MGSSYKNFWSFLDPVRDGVGYALFLAQTGNMHGAAKPLQGFGGAGVVELVDDHQGNTYRAVYTVKFGEAVYVLHAFQKKSKQGRKTSSQDMEMIRRRLKAAEEHHRQHQTPRGLA